MNKRQIRATITAWIFILPFFILFTIFTVYPIIQGVWVSLNKWNLMGKQNFVGLENYEKLFTDDAFDGSLWHTVQFVLMCTPVLVILPLIMALFANRPVKYKRFLRISYYLPGVLSVSVISFIAKYTFAPYRGLVNGILRFFGVINTKSEILWFESTGHSWAVVAIMTIWWTVGFPMLLYLSALQDIPQETMDAAEVDGASGMQQLFRIKLPLLKPTVLLVLMLQIIACFKVFGQIYMTTGGGPANTTRPLVMYIYQQAFNKNKLGYSAAMSYILFAILVVCTLLQFKLQKGEDEN